MKLLCVGLCKTGTKSLAKALRILGYKVYDFDDQSCELAQLWTNFLDGKVTDEEIRKSLEEIDVLIDGQVIAFWEDINRAIPDTKIILTTRDEESWWQSYKRLYNWDQLYIKTLFLMAYLTPTGYRIVHTAARCSKLIFGIECISFAGFTNNPRLYKLKFRQHNNHVIKTMERESSKFLIYHAGDDWAPLCKFLNKEVPADIPYPHLNRDASFFTKEGGPKNKQFRRAMREAYVALFCMLGLALYLLYCLCCLFLF